jgi:hypothetical protein
MGGNASGRQQHCCDIVQTLMSANAISHSPSKWRHPLWPTPWVSADLIAPLLLIGFSRSYNQNGSEILLRWIWKRSWLKGKKKNQVNWEELWPLNRGSTKRLNLHISLRDSSVGHCYRLSSSCLQMLCRSPLQFLLSVSSLNVGHGFKYPRLTSIFACSTKWGDTLAACDCFLVFAQLQLPYKTWGMI